MELEDYYDSSDIMPSGTNVTNLGLVFIVLMCIWTFSSDRRRALLPILMTVCYMPLGQMVYVIGLHMHFFRILLLIGVCRILTRGEHRQVRWNKFDSIFFLWVGLSFVMAILQKPTWDKFINAGGALYSDLGMYFVARCWIRDRADFYSQIRFVAILILPLALFMINEKITGRNLFSVFGGVPEMTYIREGRLRCQGPFRHPILAGTLGVVVFPMFVALWRHCFEDRKRALLGIGASGVIMYTSASSGPLLAFGACIAGWALWRMRYEMWIVRRSVVVLIVALSFVMNAPVWYIYARLSGVTGGTGWHRSYLIDQAISHIDEWWFVGSTYTAHWSPTGAGLPGDPDNIDITNQFIYEGIHGGILRLIIFVVMVVAAYKIVGARVRDADEKGDTYGLVIWAMGVSLTGHILSFMSVAYFDQLMIFWLWLLAGVANLEETKDDPVSIPEPEEEPIQAAPEGL